jgi:amino acid adenylation domain-containing protein
MMFRSLCVATSQFWATMVSTMASETSSTSKGSARSEKVPPVAISPGWLGVSALFEASAARHGDALAVVDGDESLSYVYFFNRVAELAEHLRKLGVRRGSLVGLHLRRSSACLIALHAVMRAGGAYIPLDINLPAGRRELLLDDTKPELVLVDDAWVDTPAGRAFSSTGRVATLSRAGSVCRVGKSVADLEPVEDSRESGGPQGSADGSCPSDLVYIIHTSGSTGRPKGVKVTQQNLLSFLGVFGEVVRKPLNGRWLWTTPLSFDPSVVEVIWTFMMGGTVSIAPDDALAADLGSLIRHGGITHLQCTPTRAQMLLADPSDRASLGSLRQMFIGGEVLRPALAEDLLSTGLGRLTNLYGPTETTVWAFKHDVDRRGRNPIPIGVPLTTTSVMVVDKEGNNLGVDEVGELLIGGPEVSDGYHEQIELTNQVFVEFLIEGELRRVYRTGDLVSKHTDGTFTFHGRTDDQIKLRGVRIELAEIEASVESHPDVARAVVVVAGGNDSAHQRLVSFIVCRQSVDVEEVRSWLSDRLDGPMLPAEVCQLDRFPMTSSGKVDRVSLRESAESRPLRSPIERAAVDAGRQHGNESVDSLKRFSFDLEVMAIAGDMSAILGRSVETNDDFFERGGHSLLAVELFARIHARTGVLLPLRLLVDASTPFALAQRIEVEARTTATVVVPFHNTQKNNPRLWLVHGAGGNVLAFRDLATELESDWTVLGLQALGVNPSHSPDLTLQAMVERYVEAIRRTQPDGPYMVGGYSDGGYIAAHVAAHLVAEGAKVGPLVLIDAFVGSEIPSGPARLQQVFGSWSTRAKQPTVEWVLTSWKAWRRRKSDSVRDAAEAIRLSKSGYHDLFGIIDQACRNGGPVRPVVAIDSVMFRAKEANPTMRRDYWWVSELGGRATAVFVSGDHRTILQTPNVETLAAKMRMALTDWR